MTFFDKLLTLTKQLYPRGRAFFLSVNSNINLLHEALALSENRLLQNSQAVLDTILPDNPNFLVQDIENWEKRLGIIPSSLNILTNRINEIKRKYNTPGNVRGRNNLYFLENQLNIVNFNVHVFNNYFILPDGTPGTKTPKEIIGNIVDNELQLGDTQLGTKQLSYEFYNICVNYVDEATDHNFTIGNNLRSTIFIGGTPLGTFIDIPIYRKDEFRRLILRIKPVQVVAYLFVNYV